MSPPIPSQNTLPIAVYTRRVLSELMIPQPPRERFFKLFCDHLHGRSEKEIREVVEIIFESRLSSNKVAAFNARGILLKLVDMGKGKDVASGAVSKHMSECKAPWDGEDRLKTLFEQYKPSASS